MENDELDCDDIDNITIDPKTIHLDNLLYIAEHQDDHCVVFRGDLSDGSTQWGIIAVCGEDAGTLMNMLEDALLVARTKMSLASKTKSETESGQSSN